MTKWRIRRANVRDSGGFSECIDAAYSVYASRIVDLPAVSEGISDDIEKDRVWIAEIGPKIVGGIVLIPEDDFLLLANVAVRPECSGLGLGRALMGLAEAECRKLGLNELRLRTHVSIPENVSLYEHLGWQETGKSGTKVHMRKTL
jgi:GNAT superfamily N-acetyltransferase